MHNTNGVLERSGKDEGTYHSIPPRDPTLPQMPSHLPEASELGSLSFALRERIYGSAMGIALPKHYVRRPHYCDNCPESFTSKSALREHMFQRHSY
ncbi:MAG TPA: hypothetical protein VJP79_00750 [Nitrososphaera sp.]|nr:hypothetical protein [Nitrososphaera sp.]